MVGRILVKSFVCFVLSISFFVAFGQDKTILSNGFYKEDEKSKYSFLDNEKKEPIFIADSPFCTINEIKQAVVDIGINGLVEIQIEFNDAGKEYFRKATKESIGKRIALIVDDSLIVAPVVITEIEGGKISLTGNYTEESATNIVSKLTKDGNPVRIVKHQKSNLDNLKDEIEKFDKALMNKNDSVLLQILHPDVSIGYPNGIIKDKDAFIKDIQNRNIVYQKIDPLRINQFKAHNDQIQVRRDLHITGTENNKPFDDKISVLEIWVIDNQQGYWQLWALQGVKIK